MCFTSAHAYSLEQIIFLVFFNYILLPGNGEKSVYLLGRFVLLLSNKIEVKHTIYFGWPNIITSCHSTIQIMSGLLRLKTSCNWSLSSCVTNNDHMLKGCNRRYDFSCILHQDVHKRAPSTKLFFRQLYWGHDLQKSGQS